MWVWVGERGYVIGLKKIIRFFNISKMDMKRHMVRERSEIVRI
jgi:hypothetical protein